MAIIAKAVKTNTLKTVQRAAIAADQTAVLKTPVDTGRARANWRVSVGSPNLETISEPERKGRGEERRGAAAANAANIALEEGRQVSSSYRLGQGGIFITNNVPYIVKLDQGSSDQAPQGMTAEALMAAKRQLGGARLLGGV